MALGATQDVIIPHIPGAVATEKQDPIAPFEELPVS